MRSIGYQACGQGEVVNRAEFQQLAEDRLRDAEVLLQASRWSGAYYLAGYAVECALKSCIAKLTREHDFPNKTFAQSCYTHNIESLVGLADLTAQRDRDAEIDGALDSNWQIVKEWNEAARYDQKSQETVELLFQAIADGEHGVMQWLRIHW